MTDRSWLMRRACALGVVGLAAALLVACTVKPSRPAPGARLVDAVAVDEEHGLLLFSRAPESNEGPPAYLAKHDKDGPVAWVRALDLPYESIDGATWHALLPASGRASRIVGGSALLVLTSNDDEDMEALLRVTLDRGESTIWTSTSMTSRSMFVWAVVGDARQVFVVWGARPVQGRSTLALEIAAFDQQTGARSWTRSRQIEAEDFERGALRLTDGWLMFSDARGDWQLLRRSDGEHGAAIVADPPGMCAAHGRWWAQRGDHLLALDLGGEVATQRSVLAEFIAAPGRHQWSLQHCGEHGDEVVLLVDQGPAGGGLLVGIDPATMQTRWTLALPVPIRPRIPLEAPSAATRFGDVALVGDLGVRCAVDLAQRSVRACGARVHEGIMIADGEDTVLYNELDHGTAFSLHRIGGADGEVKAAIEVSGAQEYERDDIWTHGLELRGGLLWFNSRRWGNYDTTGALQHVVIDGRTLRRIERPWRDEHGALDGMPPKIRVQDMMPELDSLLARFEPDRGLTVKDEPPELLAIDPLVHWISGGRPGEAATPVPPRAGLFAELWAVAREQGQLPAQARIHVLAWRAVTGKYLEKHVGHDWFEATGRRDDVLAVAEHQGPDGAVWVVLRASSGPSGNAPATEARVFTRRPTEVDIHRFVGREHGPWDNRLHGEASQGGAIDEAAWQTVIGAPRVQRWLLPRSPAR